jgi:2'-5' RNA ligase
VTSRPQSQCAPSCARYRSPFNPENTTGLAGPFCAAFPGGIPDRIWRNELDHRQPVDGDHGLQWVAAEGYEFPEYAFDPAVLGQGAVVAASEPGEPHTGAMVALLPADPDMLAVDGGEPADQLHCTLLFLGEAADIGDDARARILEAAADVALGWAPFEAEAFSVAMFNPHGEEPCVVLGLTGVDLAELFDEISDVVEPSVEQHQPWQPHITVAYTDDPAMVGAVVDRCGPVLLDRIRVAFGDQVTDIPLGEPDLDDEDDDLDDSDNDETEPVEVASARVRWDGCPRCFNPIHDGACVTVP